MQDLLKFVLLLVFEISAVFASIFIFIYFITHPVARSQPKNHVWLVLLIFNFLQLTIDLPMSMSFYYLGKVWPATNAYCVWWTWHQHLTTFICLILTTRASVERHFIIFHPTFIVGTSRKKWVFHFAPIIVCISVPTLWYTILIVISPMCATVWNFDYIICGVPCYESADNRIYGIVDTLNTILPLMIITLANTILMARVIYEKNSRNQIIDWRRHRKMVLQLWFISSLCLAGWLPFAITQFTRIIALSTFLDDQLATMIYIRDFISVILPFVCLGVFPEITNSIRKVLRRQRGNQVGTVLIGRQTQFRTRL